MDKTSTRFASIWDALAGTAEEAANLKVRVGQQVHVELETV